MDLRQVPRLLLAQECSVCLRLRDEAEAQEVAAEVALAGALRWAVCPACGRRADRTDAAYRVRARAYTGQLTYVEDDPARGGQEPA